MKGLFRVGQVVLALFCAGYAIFFGLSSKEADDLKEQIDEGATYLQEAYEAVTVRSAGNSILYGISLAGLLFVRRYPVESRRGNMLGIVGLVVTIGSLIAVDRKFFPPETED